MHKLYKAETTLTTPSNRRLLKNMNSKMSESDMLEWSQRLQ